MKKLNKQSGFTLVLLLLFMVVAITITAAAVAMTIVNSSTSTKMEVGMNAEQIAESGAENALMRLLRDSSYTGETMTIDSGTATITVATVGTTKTITSVGKVYNFSRTIQVVVSYTNNILTVTSWKEIF